MGGTSPDRHPKLSLCMIVRNGGAALEDALQSARPFTDEIVVVDTGSTDDSRRVAAACGARVVEFPWCDDFSAARNCSLEHARGQWVFWMDADDTLPADAGAELRRQLEATPAQDAAFWVSVEEEVPDRSGGSRVMAHAHVKLFPRHPEIRFIYRVHEQVAPAIRALGMPIRPTSAVVRHAHVDRTPDGERSRLDRNLRLGLLDLRERPDDPFVWLCLGTTYLHLPGEAIKGAEFLARSTQGLKHGSATQLNAFLYLGQALAAAGDHPAERAAYQQALATFPDDAILLMRLGAWHERHGNRDDAIGCYEHALARGKLRRAAIQVREGPLHVTLRLGWLYANSDRQRQAQQIWIQYLDAHPDATPVRRALLELQLKFPSTLAE